MCIKPRMSKVQLLLIPTAAWITYGICLVAYRLLFHPLRSFPGPAFAAATYWYEAYLDLFAGPVPGRGNWHIDKLHSQYGAIVRVNPDELSVKDPDFFEVLTAGGRRDKWTKGNEANGTPGVVASIVS